jgi:hypothetical protein
MLAPKTCPKLAADALKPLKMAQSAVLTGDRLCVKNQMVDEFSGDSGSGRLPERLTS